MNTKTEYFTLNRRGEPVPVADVLTWAEWFENSLSLRRVAREEIGKYVVSTVFIGINQELGAQPPRALGDHGVQPTRIRRPRAVLRLQGTGRSHARARGGKGEEYAKGNMKPLKLYPTPDCVFITKSGQKHVA